MVIGGQTAQESTLSYISRREYQGGFHGLLERFAVKPPQYVNGLDRVYGSPLHVSVLGWNVAHGRYFSLRMGPTEGPT